MPPTQARGSPGGEGGERERVERLISLVVEAERLRNRIPDSIYEGSFERALRSIAYEADFLAAPPSHGPLGAPAYTGLYSDVRHEAMLLSRLAAALRLRMESLGRVDLSGVDYFRRRVDLFLERIRLALGFNPRIPLYLQLGRWGRRAV